MSLIGRLAGVFIALAAAPLAAQSGDDIESFFARWQELEQDHRAAVADFYADNARIIIRRRFRDGYEQELIWSGLRYKTYIREIWPQSDGKPGERNTARSLYSKTSIERLPNGFRISGERYWTGDCSTDPDWYILVSRDADGVLTIVEEAAIETVYSLCGEETTSG